MSRMLDTPNVPSLQSLAFSLPRVPSYFHSPLPPIIPPTVINPHGVTAPLLPFTATSSTPPPATGTEAHESDEKSYRHMSSSLDSPMPLEP